MNQYELKQQQKTNKIIYEFSGQDNEEEEKYEKFKNKFKLRLKRWHNILSGAGVTGDPALDDIINIIMICYLDKNKTKYDLLNREKFKKLDDDEYEEYIKYFKISELLKIVWCL